MLMAIALLMGGIAACLLLFSRGIFATNDAEKMEQAIALAQERMESIRGTSFSAIVNEPPQASDPPIPVTGWPGFYRRVVVTPFGSNGKLKLVAVTVYVYLQQIFPAPSDFCTSLTSYVANTNN